MSRYRVEITRDVLGNLAKLDKPVRRRVQSAIDGLGERPRPPGMIASQGLQSAYRLRVGDYRVIYTVEDSRLVVLVVDSGWSQHPGTMTTTVNLQNRAGLIGRNR